jgi:hypothetical protein
MSLVFIRLFCSVKITGENGTDFANQGNRQRRVKSLKKEALQKELIF